MNNFDLNPPKNVHGCFKWSRFFFINVIKSHFSALVPGSLALAVVTHRLLQRFFVCILMETEGRTEFVLIIN